ncbi:MAG: uracil-DNA glycosylase [Betaproteobacteria bacterium]
MKPIQSAPTGPRRLVERDSAPHDSGAVYDVDCRRCERLARFLDEVRVANPGYFCAPVPPFGPLDASLVIVGLAPGMHGANASGRPFTGDYAGILLYATLHKFGFASKPTSTGVDDGLELLGARITNAVKCLPPANKPLPAEIRNCNDYLAADLAQAAPGSAILALGTVAHEAGLRALSLPLREFAFAHGAEHALPAGLRLFDSYHCSRYNTNTRRLTTAMFEAVFARIVQHLGTSSPVAA